MNAIVKPKLIAGNANKPLAAAIARRVSIHRGELVELVKTRVERFNDQEIFVEVFENVRGEDMFIIQSTSNPANDNLMELMIMTDALRRSSAARITAVMPYFGYARQDRRSKARTPISAKLVANLLTVAGIERVLTVDLHAAQIQGFFDIPVDNLYAAPVFALDIRHHFREGRADHRGLARRGRRGAGARAGRAHRRRSRHRRQAPGGAGRGRLDDGDRRGEGPGLHHRRRHRRHRGHAGEGGRAAARARGQGGACLHQPRRAVRPGGRAHDVLGAEEPGHHRFDRADAGGPQGARTSASCPWRRCSARRS
jgi:hypothetical protein